MTSHSSGAGCFCFWEALFEGAAEQMCQPVACGCAALQQEGGALWCSKEEGCSKAVTHGVKPCPFVPCESISINS
jgi:hypothetical protein